MNPIFILGHPKSGTTLITSLLDYHPQLMVIPEETDYYSIIKPQIDIKDKYSLLFKESHLSNYLRGNITHDIGGNFDYSCVDKEKFTNAILNDDSLISIVDTIRKTFYNGTEFKYWVEKTPKHIYHIEEIKKDFPQAKFIFIYRDPRDNYISYKKKRGNRINAISFSNDWNKCFSIAEKCDNLLFVKYEDLVLIPEKTINQIVKFLQIDFNRSLLTPTKTGNKWNGNSMFNETKNRIDASGIGRYKEFICKSDLRTLETLCRSNMIKYSYPLNKPSLYQIAGVSINKYLYQIKMSIISKLPYRLKKKK
jgi:hypothetical protein